MAELVNAVSSTAMRENRLPDAPLIHVETRGVARTLAVWLGFGQRKK